MIESVLALNVIVFTLTVLWLNRRGYINLFSGLTIYLAFHFLVFVQRPIIVYLFDIRSEFIGMNFYPSDDIFIETIVLTNFGLMSFLIGYLAALNFTPLQIRFSLDTLNAIESKSFFLAFLLLLPLISYSLFLAAAMRQDYGVETFGELGRIQMLADAATGASLFVDTTGYLVLARSMLLPFATFLVFYFRGVWYSYFPLAVSALIAFGTGSRWPMVVTALVVIMILLYIRRRSTLTVGSVILLAFILAAFVIIGQNRNVMLTYLRTGELGFDFDLATSSFGAHADFANFEFLTFVVSKVPDVSKTYSYFTQYLGLFTQPIPRMLWPDKPSVSPIMLVNLQAYGPFSPRTPSLVGDGWISLGYPGVVITLGLVGAFYGKLYKWLCTSASSSFSLCSCFWATALLIQWARDGGISIFQFCFFCIAPIFLAFSINRLMFARSTINPRQFPARRGRAPVR